MYVFCYFAKNNLCLSLLMVATLHYIYPLDLGKIEVSTFLVGGKEEISKGRMCFKSTLIKKVRRRSTAGLGNFSFVVVCRQGLGSGQIDRL